eukprot:GHRR01033852.1.p1 GENE.GHRR01033852.1~~GHRR01033852.1.p1  ORF type:complete len:124 (+),score=9.27 GHRR01033852.1:447-818(+)
MNCTLVYLQSATGRQTISDCYPVLQHSKAEEVTGPPSRVAAIQRVFSWSKRIICRYSGVGTVGYRVYPQQHTCSIALFSSPLQYAPATLSSSKASGLIDPVLSMCGAAHKSHQWAGWSVSPMW